MVTLSSEQVTILIIVLSGLLLLSISFNIYMFKLKDRMKRLETSFLELIDSVMSVYSSLSSYLSKELGILEGMNSHISNKDTSTQYVR